MALLIKFCSKDAIKKPNGKPLRALGELILKALNVVNGDPFPKAMMDIGKLMVANGIVADALGLVFLVVIHATNLHDSPAALLVVSQLARQGFERLNMILADGTYDHKLAVWMKKLYGLILEVIKVRELGGFQVVPMRWKVERTFA